VYLFAPTEALINVCDQSNEPCERNILALRCSTQFVGANYPEQIGRLSAPSDMYPRPVHQKQRVHGTTSFDMPPHGYPQLVVFVALDDFVGRVACECVLPHGPDTPPLVLQCAVKEAVAAPANIQHKS
jgi:hypothetical protein